MGGLGSFARFGVRVLGFRVQGLGFSKYLRARKVEDRSRRFKGTWGFRFARVSRMGASALSFFSGFWVNLKP